MLFSWICDERLKLQAQEFKFSIMFDQMCYIFICRPSLLFFHQKNSRKFRIRSFRIIHHRTAKLLALLLSKKVWTLVLTLVQTKACNKSYEEQLPDFDSWALTAGILLSKVLFFSNKRTRL